MLRSFAAAALFASVAAVPASAVVTVTAAFSEGVHTDLFEGAAVGATSPILGGFSAADAFGAITSNPTYPESLAGGHVIFGDTASQFIEFSTAAPIILSSFKIYLSSDGPLSSDRAFTTVGLSYFNGTSYQSLGSASFNLLGPVTVSAYFAPVTASQFRFDGTALTNGPRLMEIDGAVPEPASWLMMVAGFGLAGWAMRTRRPARVRFG